MAGLFGLGGIGGIGGAQPPTGLLGPYYNPADMRKQQLKQGLLQAGIGLLTNGKGSTGEVLGQGFAAGLQGANQAGINYKQDAMGYNQMAQQMEAQAEKKKQKEAIAAWVSKLPPEQQAMAEAYPEQYATQYLQQQFATQSASAKPAGIQEYEYAKSQGFPGTFQDWEASKKGGMSLQMNPDGSMTFQQGGNIKPMTEAQSKDTVFSTRAEGAEKVFENVESGLTGVQGIAGNSIGQLPVVGNMLKTEGFQKAEQAGQEFLQAILRKDTGAAITPGEQALYGTVYLPAPGDTANVIAQKKASRQRAINALKAGMTPQAILAQEQALAKEGKNPTAPLGTNSGGVIKYDAQGNRIP